MFSKTALQKMALELSVTTLVSLARESIGSIGETVDEKAQEAIGTIEVIVAELRRRTPKPTPAPDANPNPPRANRRKITTPPATTAEPPALSLVEGGNANGG